MANNNAINLNQLKKSVFNMKNYIDSKVPTINDSEKYILRKTITKNINFDDPDIITTDDKFKSVIKNLEITNESLSKENISVKIQSDDGITFNKDITEYLIDGAKVIILDKSTLDANGKAVSFILTINRKAIKGENGNLTYEINNNYCTFMIRSLETGKHPLTDYNRSKKWTVTLTYYDINSKYYQKMYNIPSNIEDGMGVGSIQQKGNTSTGVFAFGSKNNGRGFLLGSSNTSENSSCVFGKGNACTGINPGYFFGEGNKSHGIGGGFTLGSGNNVEGITIAVGRKLTTNEQKNGNAGAMIIGQGGTLSQDSRFMISTANTNCGEIRYPFDAKDNGDTYIRGKNVFLETEEEITNEKSIVNKKYVDTKVAGIVNSAPETLDTLQELATALGNDPNFATTVATQIGKKVDKVEGMSLTHNDLTNELKANYDAAYAYSQAKHSYNDLTDKPVIPSIDGLATTKYVDDTSKLVKEDINDSIIDIKNELNPLYYGSSSSDNYKTIVYNDVLKGKFIYSEECKRGLTTGTAYFININDSKLINDSLTMVFFKIKYKDSNNQIFNDICYEGVNDNFECSIKNNESKIFVSFKLRINKEITSDGTINEKNKSLILQVSIWDKTKYIGNENILETIEINMYSKMRNYLPISSYPAANFTPTKEYQPTNKKYVDDTVVFKKLSSIIEVSSDGQKIANVEKFEDKKIYYFINDINEGATTIIPISLYKNGEKNSIIMIYPNDRFITMSYNVSKNEFFSFSDMQSVKFNLVDKTREYNTSRSVTKKVSAEQVLTKTNTTEFTPTSDYHPTTKKYVDDKVVGLATETYVDSKTSMENVIYEGNGTGPDVISDYWTGCPVVSGNGCWVINKQIEFDSSKPNPYYLLCDSTLYSPENSTFDKINSAWIYPKVHNAGTIFICNKYNGENKLVLPWDDANSPTKMKLYTKTELAKAMFSGDYNDLSNKPTIPSIAGLATEEYVNNKVTDTATSLTNDPDIYLTKDKYQYVTGVNTVDNIIWLPSTNLPAFLKIHLYVTNCKMQSNFDTLVTWKSGQNPNEGKFKIISDNIYEFMLTYINGSWIGELVTYSNTEYTPTNDADVTTKKYVDDRLNNLNIKTITQSEYDSLESKEPNTLYLITE